MLDAILRDNGSFSNYSPEHLICFMACICFILVALYLAKNHWNADKQRKYITIICVFGAMTQIFKIWYRLYIVTFDPTVDLPLHLCNIITLIMPFIMWYRWKLAWAVTYFWIISACAQSIFTPTLTDSMPNYEAIRYWAVHAIIILAAFYGHSVYNFSLDFKDAIKSGIGLNLLAMVIYPINMALDSNYMYLNAKPPGRTFYDLLGPWPEYIISLEIALVIIFSIILIPFYWDKLKANMFLKGY
ncbi:MAG: TIGR02206 family membrane protein [Saprospiraceae bacterium]|nr:TIGR02206 family membrane protein [Saprospiraceae bacterium]